MADLHFDQSTKPFDGPPARRARPIAFYLPQFHAIPENDVWWGAGYTEWVPVKNARPLFRGHYQPHVPTELGYYDLASPDARSAQAQLARDHGLEAFCYWHYWFAGKQMLERPFNAVLRSGEPDFPFCLGWANHSWNSVWYFGSRGRQLMQQTYPGLDDHRAHFEYLLAAFADDRYVTVDGQPLFFFFQPYSIPDLRRLIDLWRELAHRAGLKGLYLVLNGQVDVTGLSSIGADAACFDPLTDLRRRLMKFKLPGDWSFRYRVRSQLRKPLFFAYADVTRYLAQVGRMHEHDHPLVYANWDNTPRAHYAGMVWQNPTPDLFRRHLQTAIESVAARPVEHRLIFLKAWNEWGEGNYLEPEQRYGRGYLEAIRDEIMNERSAV